MSEGIGRRKLEVDIRIDNYGNNQKEGSINAIVIYLKPQRIGKY